MVQSSTINLSTMKNYIIISYLNFIHKIAPLMDSINFCTDRVNLTGEFISKKTKKIFKRLFFFLDFWLILLILESKIAII